MDELDDRGKRVMRLAGIAEAAGRKQDERGAQSLAAAVDDVFRHLTDEDDVGIQAVANDLVDGAHVVGQEGLQALQ